MKDGTLFPIEITQYDQWVIREALHNCIAHQDYQLHGRINVIEMPDQLIFTNRGSFIPGSVENVIQQNAPAEIYRNSFLAQAMVNLNMIDTVGSGIKKMFETQRRRFFPMPDYDLSEPERVVVKIAGKILDENYTRTLMDNTSLDLATVVLLDRVQKHLPISKEQHEWLKSKQLVEGRYPLIYVSAKIAAATGNTTDYISNRGLDNQYYRDMILALIRQKGSASRRDIDSLLFKKLPDILNESQKKTKVGNLLTDLRSKGLLKNTGSAKYPVWVLQKY